MRMKEEINKRVESTESSVLLEKISIWRRASTYYNKHKKLMPDSDLNKMISESKYARYLSNEIEAGNFLTSFTLHRSTMQMIEDDLRGGENEEG